MCHEEILNDTLKNYQVTSVAFTEGELRINTTKGIKKYPMAFVRNFVLWDEEGQKKALFCEGQEK